MTISLTVIAFPHMLARLMAAGDDRALRSVCRLHPVALFLLWLPAVLIGVWGAGAFPGLEEPDRIFHMMAGEHMPAWIGVLGFLAVLTAVMSTLDARILTLSSMLVRDVLDPLRGERREGDVRIGRAFALLVAAVVFAISRMAFEGYTTLVPALFLGVRWRRFTAAGALASILTGNAVLALGWAGWIPTLGFLPVFWAVAMAAAVGVVVSRLRPARDETFASAAFGR